jgi:hypothetical protein
VAEILDEFDFTKRGTGRGRPEKYPWDNWTNGEIWKIVAGTDFSCKAENIQGALFNAARKRGMRVKTKKLDEKTVVFQFSNSSE